MLECEKKFGIFDAKFMDHGNKCIIAANLGIVIYDLVAEKVESEKLGAHWNDVNQITFSGDKNDSSVFVSAGDDGIAHIWDKRDLKQSVGSKCSLF